MVARDGRSFTVAEGQTFRLADPNGADKTTAMRIILGVLESDAGQVRWFRPMTDRMSKRVGHMAQDHGQTFSTQFARLEAQQQQTLCQVGQQPQHPPTDPPCRCGQAERHRGKGSLRSRFSVGRWL
jgi:ABC-type Mn2+/Zn2+ transport system ATPase subunit